MSENVSSDIVLASQNGCDLVLTTEDGGDFPAGSKVFFYKDNNGALNGFDATLVPGTRYFIEVLNDGVKTLAKVVYTYNRSN